MTTRIYVVSKIRHVEVWRTLRQRGLPIISSWIDDGELVDFAEAWPRYLAEAASATHVLVFTRPGECLKGGLFEIGAGLGAGAQLLIVGDPMVEMRTLIHHPAIRTVSTLAEAWAQLSQTPQPSLT